jgi:AbrB family looped-hinge helix DNA binding protein
MPYRRPYRLKATLTSKGQITVPVELRRRWDLKAGDQLDFTLEDDSRVVLRKRIRLSILDIANARPPNPAD